MINSALKYLHQCQARFLGETIRYLSRGSEDIRAVPGSYIFRISTDYGASIRVTAQDFIVTVDELPEPPQRGDQVKWRGRIYEVMAPEGEPVWRWTDTSHTARRIHTKEVG